MGIGVSAFIQKSLGHYTPICLLYLQRTNHHSIQVLKYSYIRESGLGTKLDLLLPSYESVTVFGFLKIILALLLLVGFAKDKVLQL